MKLPAFLGRLICRVFNVVITTDTTIAAEAKVQYDLGYNVGLQQAKVHFAVLPLPFTADQLRGREYGNFVTPAGFASTFGECNIPAPNQHGYEQRAYYVEREQLDSGYKAADLTCHRHFKFAEPQDSHALVPVIVTVLR